MELGSLEGKCMSSSHPIRVLIVDEHAMLRRGLKAVIRTMPDMELVGEASSGLEAVQMCELGQPDVVLMDLAMPVLDGTQAIRLMRQRWPLVHVIVLTALQEPELARDALEAGATGYLLKNVSTSELGRAIRTAHSGHNTIAPEILQAMKDRIDDLPGHESDLPGACE